MPELDVFEARFTAAYRRYLDEVPTEVDAAAIARSVAGHTRPRAFEARRAWWRPVPAGAWLLVAVALLGAVLVGSYLIGGPLPLTPVAPTAAPTSSQPASPAPSPQLGLMGTWSSPKAEPELLLLHPCGLGEICGRFEMYDDNRAHCIYALEYRPRNEDAFVYWTTDVNTFKCAYTPLLGTELFVRPSPDGTVDVWYELNGALWTSWELSLRSTAYEPELPPSMVGTWHSVGGHLFSAEGQESLRLDPCGPGEWCGSLTRVDANGDECSYTLQYRPKTFDDFVFWVATASGAPCDTLGWAQTELRVRPVAVGQILVSHWPGIELTLYQDGFEPGPSASPPAGG